MEIEKQPIMEIEKQPMSVGQFRESLAKIKAGDFSEFQRAQHEYALTIEQYNAFSDAHEFAIKSIQ